MRTRLKRATWLGLVVCLFAPPLCPDSVAAGFTSGPILEAESAQESGWNRPVSAKLETVFHPEGNTATGQQKADESSHSFPPHSDPRELWAHPGPASLAWLHARGVEEQSWIWAAEQVTPRILYVHFRQAVDGVPLDGTRMTLQWNRDGELLRSRAQWFSGVSSTDRTAASNSGLSQEEAREFLLEAFPSSMEIETWHDTEFLARPRAAAGSPTGSPTIESFWAFEFSTLSPAGWFQVWIDAESGVLLRKENMLRHGVIEGHVSGDIEERNSGDTYQTRPFAGQEILVEGDSGGLVRTDAAGNFSLKVDDDRTYQVISSLAGSVRIENIRNNHAPADTHSVGGTADLTLQWTDDNSTASDRDAFYHGSIAHQTTRKLDGGPVLDPLDVGIRLRVDDNTGTCNAFWNGSSITFYAEGGGCVAAARISDIVYHEYGHAVTHHVYGPFRAPRDMDEAWSDYFAASTTGSPEIGSGFSGPGTFVRELETDRIWPDDQHQDPHLQGLILAGALWDLRERVGKEVADPLFHFARYGLPDNFDDYLLDILVYDDDDANLDNGTPHFSDIIAAFRPHGIGDYRVSIRANLIPDTEDLSAPIEENVHIESLLGLDPDSLALFHRYTGEDQFKRVSLRPTATRRAFQATIPAPASGSRIEYYWAASDTSGDVARLPEDAPSSVYAFFAGPDLIPPTIAHLADDVLTTDQSSLHLFTEVDDNSARVSSVWVEYSVEKGAVVREEFTRTSTDEVRPSRYETKVELGTLLPGDVVQYRIGADDNAAKTNSAVLPAEDWFERTVRNGETHEFELKPGPFASAGDWEWGVSSRIPAPRLGERVWGTVLNGPYADDNVSVLTWGPLDISSFQALRLELEHYYDIVPNSDGARVRVSEDGLSWKSIIPGQGYPANDIPVFGAPGYGGLSDGWVSDTFSLDDYLGDTLWIRFDLVSDPRAADFGWYLDRVRLVNAQALIAPFLFETSNGESERVTLTWRPPRGIDLFSGRFLGYQVYRALGDGPFSDQPIHSTPLIGTQFVDRDVTNGQTYRYRLEALYGEGVSSPLVDSATPAAPQLAFDVTEVSYKMVGIAESDTTLFLKNVGAGTLEFDVFLAEPGWTFDDARVEVEMENVGADFTLVATDAEDSFGNPDVKAISLRRYEDAKFGPMFEFLIEGHSEWGDAAEDFGGVLFMDTDRNLATRPEQSFGWNEQLNIGWESIVLFGALTEGLGSSAPALFFDANDLSTAIPLQQTSFPESGSQLRFSVPVAQVGDPEFLQMSLIFVRDENAEPHDRIPEMPNLPWLIREPRHGRARGGETEFLSFQFNARAIGNGTYNALAFVRTNDPAVGLLELPIQLEVDGTLPLELAAYAFLSLPEGMEVSFVIPAGNFPVGAQIQRRGSDDLWGILTDELILPDPNNRFEFLDETVDPGASYDYRFRVQFDTGDWVTYGPFDTIYRRGTPDQLGLFMDGPNPFRNETAVLLELPNGGPVAVEVFDISGRQVHELERRDLQAGAYKITWTGRSSSGESLPSGVYFIRAVTPSGRRTLRVLHIH